MGEADLLTHLLREVSRSFYLTLRVLPGAIRPQIGLAYLLARATDTVADTAILPVGERLQVLDRLRLRITGELNERIDLSAMAVSGPGGEGFPPIEGRGGVSSAERLLLLRIEEVINCLRRFSTDDQELIRVVLSTITTGQVLDLKRFAGVSPGSVLALQTDAELDDYIYRVAGCVGEFWTRICRKHAFRESDVNEAFLLEKGVRFGKGLQLVNILRDLARDARQGRCYLPSSRLQACGLQPVDLLNVTSEDRLRPLYDEYLKTAFDHLQAGWAYTNHIPWNYARVRLACAWPILIGVGTLKRLKCGPVLLVEKPARIPRAEVRRILLRTILLYPWPGLWRRQWPGS